MSFGKVERAELIEKIDRVSILVLMDVVREALAPRWILTPKTFVSILVLMDVVREDT